MIIDCISDLHGFYPELQGGDLLIVAGDLTARDETEQYLEFYEWLDNQDYKKKILIAGNHDNQLQDPRHVGNNERFYPSEYLCDSGIEFCGLKIWGSPWTTKFPGINPHCCAFTVDTDEELSEKWELIPKDTDILITHCPPYNWFDESKEGHLCGSGSLFLISTAIKPQLHVFGHIHECGGKKKTIKWCKKETTYVNASYVNERYKPVNKPIRIII